MNEAEEYEELRIPSRCHGSTIPRTLPNVPAKTVIVDIVHVVGDAIVVVVLVDVVVLAAIVVRDLDQPAGGVVDLEVAVVSDVSVVAR